MDGLGWLLNKKCLLMKTYPHMTADYIDWELDGAQGWAYANWARANEGSAFCSPEVNKSPGYVKQEYNELMRQYHGQRT